MKVITLLLIGLIFPLTAFGKTQIVTTTTTLESIVKAIGQGKIEANNIAKGSQDPHYIEAKPSYMVQLRSADLLVAVGLDLEVGWLPRVRRGSKNPKIITGNGYLETGQWITPIEVPEGKIDRSQGDIHPQGNPHYYLDPKRTLKVAKRLTKHLAKENPGKKSFFQSNFKKFKETMEQKLKEWQKRIDSSGIKKVVTYHKTFNYFLRRFGLEQAGVIEAKPGVPPTASHILSLIKTIKEENVYCILHESFFEKNAAQRIQREAPVTVKVVAPEVGAKKSVKNYISLIDHIVSSVEKCGAMKTKKG